MMMPNSTNEHPGNNPINTSPSDEGIARLSSAGHPYQDKTQAQHAKRAIAVKLPLDILSQEIDSFNVVADSILWPVSDHRRWDAVDFSLLTEDHIAALKFITYIEDHIPGYFSEYQRLFPLEESGDSEEFIFNREMFRFTSRWTQEEERHANVLFKYQIHAGLDDASSLRGKLADVGKKPFYLNKRDELPAIFAYTLIQEKATHLFYRQFHKMLMEPTLREILAAIAKDEARHFVFFSNLIQHCLKHYGDSALQSIKEVLFNFKMPLSDSLKGYWRISVQICDAMDYRHTDAYEHLLQILQKFTDTATSSKTQDIATFINSIRRV